MRSAVSKSGGKPLAGREEWKVWRGLNGHKGESRKQTKADLEPRSVTLGGQGVHREVESEGHEEKYRAVIEGGYRDDEPVGQRWVRSSLHSRGEGVLIHPPHQGVCGWHGTEEQRVTSGGLAESAGSTGVSRPISASEVASDALPVVGRLGSTLSAV